jgi:hypothetical protein
MTTSQPTPLDGRCVPRRDFYRDDPVDPQSLNFLRRPQ